MDNSDAHNALKGAMHDQACHWMARLRSDDAGEADYQAFALWLAASPAHRAAMDAMLELWGDLGALGEIPGLLEVALQPAEPEPDYRAEPLSRRRWLGTGLALAASVMLALVVSPRLGLGPDTQLFQTGVGENLSAALEDGSEIKLNTNTSLEVSFDATQRALTLHRGEAFFEVAHQPERPFVVRAGSLEVRALGTAFNIELRGDTGVVTVADGVVRVTELSAPATRAAQTELLYRDQRLSGNRTGLGSAEAVQVDNLLAWRDGRLVADEMPLPRLVEELSRYHPNKIFIAEPRLADRTVSGVFVLEDLDSILLALEHTAQVRSVTLEDGSVQLIGAPL